MPHQCTDCSRRFDDGSKEMLSGCPNCGGNKFQYIPASAMDADGVPGEREDDPSRPGGPDSSVARTVGNAATAVRDLVGGSSGSDGPARSDVSASPESGAEAGARSATTGRSTETTSPSSPTAADTDPEAPETAGTETGTIEGPTQSDEIEATTGSSEDSAQASARSELVSPDELPSVSRDRSGWEQTTPASAGEPSTNGTEADPDAESPEEQATERPDLSELREELNQQFESIKVVEPGQYELNLMELFDRQEYIIALQEDGKYTVQVPEHWQE